MTQVESALYFSKKYLSLERFISYYYQCDFIRDAEPKRMLLIGVGDGMVPDMLKKMGTVMVTTMDFDSDLNPDVIGDIRELDFPDDSFDLVCAFEVLEHIPLEESEKALEEMARISKRHVIISVPHRRTGFEIVIKFPGIRTILRRDYIRLACFFPLPFKGFAESGQHYWEIDGYHLSLRRFRDILRRNFTVTREQTPVLDYYHHFFSLEKTKAH